MTKMLMTLKDVTQRFGNRMILTSDLHLSSSSSPSFAKCTLRVKIKTQNGPWGKKNTHGTS